MQSPRTTSTRANFLVGLIIWQLSWLLLIHINETQVLVDAFQVPILSKGLPRKCTRVLPKQLQPSTCPRESGQSTGSGTALFSTIVKDATEEGTSRTTRTAKTSQFDMSTALFCAGLAFDAYVEPPSNSSRWERGSQGMDVAFVSSAFTRSLYKGLLEVTVQKLYDLPDDDDNTEKLMTGSGVDAKLLVAAIEGQWDEDVKMLEKESYHEGVLGLMGAAHVGQSRTAWSNINEKQSQQKYQQQIRQREKRKDVEIVVEPPPPYHIPSGWGKGGQAIFPPDEPPFYLYIQDPAKARLVFTIMDDDIVGNGDPIGSVHTKLSSLIPRVTLGPVDFIEAKKRDLMQQQILLQRDGGEITVDQDVMAETWEGEIKCTSKPRIKDKNGQVAMGAAAGAMVAGPVGAAAGAFLGSIYEGNVRGRIQAKIRYLPLGGAELLKRGGVKRKKYIVKGGLPGVDWGQMYERFRARENANNAAAQQQEERKALEAIGGTDLEHCFFINHQETGGCCAVYRSLEKKLIVVSFRGTCAPKDIVTDASLAQTTWVEGMDLKEEGAMKVHVGFRKSLQSISRRLKELILAAPDLGEDISQYDMLVTGHSLGGALATLFTLDIGEYGIDAGRALPQKAPSEAWWKSIANTLSGSRARTTEGDVSPPRPKSLRMYNFGSPRVGNEILAEKFDSLVDEGKIDQAYRIVNGDDLVARMPRTVNALALGNIGYEHCGATVLVTMPKTKEERKGTTTATKETADAPPVASLWIEGESDDNQCPVRDGTPLTSPLSNGSLLGDLVSATKLSFAAGGNDIEEKEEKARVDYAKGISSLLNQVSGRLSSIKASDITSSLGIDTKYAEREVRIIQSLASGDGLADHMEDKYYASMGKASGFIARVGEELQDDNTATV